MQKIFENYITSISSKFSHEETSEMGYRTDFEILIKGIFESINVRRIDHDAKAQQGNKPDFVVLNHDIPILYIEAKDVGISLDKVEQSEQMSRYYGYTNLVLTDYLEFRFYRNGIRYEEPIKIADFDIKNRTIIPTPENYEHIAKTLLDFTQSQKEPIRSGKHLAKIMGGKAQRIRDNIRQFIGNDSEKNVEILRVYEAIKKQLVHDLTPHSFADMYAQTLVYGLFVARYYDETPDNFSRGEARDLIPKSNPLLRHFFDHIVGPDFDTRLEYIVNELCEVFSHANVPELMKEYFKNDLWGGTHKGPDPVIHFYEDFLKEYDEDLRKKMGAYYTPLPVVQFIVRSVDHLLEKEFGLSAGLADTSKTENNVHRVQILDPAVGTGTFISDVVGKIYARILKNKQEGRWPTYVHQDLLPRLHGFELMMAPYTIAHLKLGIAFRKTGFKYFNQRLGIYLTNSLENDTAQQNLFSGFGFSESIAEESKEASIIKNKTPIMVVVGNPPYSVSSSNKNDWILDLMKAYKTDLNERNIQPLSDDYLKFIRLSEHFIEKNKSGIVAMITNNSFLDGIIHRQMRKHLLQTFDRIYILNLHGNSKKKEKASDGGKDENVFDIQQGVSINIFIRKNKDKQGLGTVHYAELFGMRNYKFEVLDKSEIDTIKWQKLDSPNPYYFFVQKDFHQEEEYKKGFQINELFNVNSVGIVTSRDSFLINDKKDVLEKRYEDILNMSISNDEFENKYKLKTKYFNPITARSKSQKNGNAKIIKCFYRPFDTRYILFDEDFIERNRSAVMKNMILGTNLALVCSKQSTRNSIDNIQVVDSVIELKFNSHDRNSNIFPLYLYSEDGSHTPNFKKDVVNEIEKRVGKVSPEDILDYIYAILHSPSYREKYKEFLKIDFPRVPYPKDKKSFDKLVAFGTELRLLHLFESPRVNKFITTYSITGSDIIEKILYKDGDVFINNDQYFGGIPESIWNFYIGGYQPAQKWLKDRKGQTLTNEDIEHYQKMIVSLIETGKIMKMIDEDIKIAENS
jgi:hypothetical protein